MNYREQARADLLTCLAHLAKSPDPEVAHCDADDALLKYINDPEITAAYRSVTKWYA